jgi:hypothetical protein
LLLGDLSVTFEISLQITELAGRKVQTSVKEGFGEVVALNPSLFAHTHGWLQDIHTPKFHVFLIVSLWQCELRLGRQWALKICCPIT